MQFRERAKDLFFLLRNLAGRLRKLDREAIAEVYLQGDGIEIGALHCPLRVPKRARVKYVDRLPVSELRKQYPELHKSYLPEVSILDDGETLSKVTDASQDFVIANHFLEHCENPLRALDHFLRVLRPGGILYLAIPDMRYTFDEKRPATEYAHLKRDYQEGPESSRQQHFEEWVRYVEKMSDEESIRKKTAELMNCNYSIHYHAWSQTELLELIVFTKQQHPLELELFVKNGAECILVLRKPSQEEPKT